MVSSANRRKKKLNPERLEGDHRNERVFIGGQYDFMPTLRVIAQFVREISTQEKKLVPILPIDYEIEEEETMARDLEILNRCRYAIFDLSDLGAQLVEMQEADQKRRSTDSLIVYPVRERKNEPERGRRTVISFGLPHFGYSNFNELKGIVWRFLMDAPAEKDYSTRAIHDPVLDREIRRIRAFIGQGRTDNALNATRELLKDKRYEEALEPYLQLAVIGCRKSDSALCSKAIEDAMKIATDDKDKEAEVLYYKGIVATLQSTPDWSNAKTNLLEANRLRPNDGRILQLLGYVHWELNEKEDALERTFESLGDPDIPDPLVSIHAASNLGYFLGEKADRGESRDLNLEEALELTKYLPAYHRVFRRRNGDWLDTRGWLLTLKAEALAEHNGRKEQAKIILQEALDLLELALQIETNPRSRPYVEDHLKRARNLEDKLPRIKTGVRP